MPIRIGRWQIELYQRAIYIQKLADPQCAQCKGSGELQHGPGIGPDGEEPDVEPCHCWDPFHSTRIPLGPRPTERTPF